MNDDLEPCLWWLLVFLFASGAGTAVVLLTTYGKEFF